jgi:diadenosine tetraphosphate (Ap4A) HIT family hydrolase
MVGGNATRDKNNLIIARFNYNYVCLSHYPKWAAELSVVPYNHASAIAHLSPEELKENMILAKILLPIVTDYANIYVRTCTGGNIYTKSVCDKASRADKKYHVHTTVIPRTVIAPTPGTVEGNSCKLDHDSDHLIKHLKESMSIIKAKMSEQ